MSKETSEYTVKYVYAMQDVVEEVKTDKKSGKTVKNEYIYGDDIDDVVAMYQEKENIFTRWEENEVGDDSTQESLYFVQKDIR